MAERDPAHRSKWPISAAANRLRHVYDMKSRRGRWAAGLSAAFLLACTGLYFVPDAALTYALRRGLGDFGMASVQLGQAELSMVRGRVVVRQMAAQPPSGPEAALNGLSVRLAWLPLLFQKRLSIESLELDGLHLHLVRDDAGAFSLRGLPPVHVPVAPANDGKPTGDAEWSFGVEDLRLTNSTLELDTPNGPAVLVINDISLKALHSWTPGSQATFTFGGALDGAAISLSGSLTAFAQHPEIRVDFATDGLDTRNIAHLALPGSTGIAGLLGRLSGNLKVDGALRGRLGFEGQVTGNLRMHAGEAKAGATAGISARMLAWNGEAVFRPDAIEFKGRAEAEGLGLTEPGRKISLGRLEAEAARFSLGMAEPMPFNWQGSLKLDGLGLTESEAEIALAKLGWSGSIKGDALGRMAYASGSLSLSGVKVSQAPATFAAGALEFDGAATLAQGQVRLSGKGSLAGIDLVSKIDGKAIRGRLASVDVSRLATILNQTSDQTSEVSVDADMAAKDVQFDGDGIALTAAGFGLKGNVGSAGKVVTVDARLDGDMLNGLLDGKWRAESRSLAMAAKGRVTADTTEATIGQLGLKGLRLGHEPAALDLLEARSLDLAQLTLDAGGGMTLGSLDLQQARALRLLKVLKGQAPYPWRISAGRLSAANAKFGGTAKLPSLASLKADGLKLAITRRNAGIAGIEAIDTLSGGPGKAPKSKAGPEPGPEPIQPFDLGRIDIGGNSEVEFVDETLPGTPGWTASSVTLLASGINGSSPGQPAAFDLAARLGEFSTIGMKGTIAPFAAKLNLDMTAEVKRIELPPVSPYLLDALGVAVRTGTADADAKASVREDALNGEARFRFNRLFMEEEQSGGSDLAKRTGMPVASILDLLRDKDDNIALRIPVSGSVADPKFDLGDAVAQAIGGAVRNAASTMLRIAFPLLVIVDAIDGSNSEAQALKPVGFAPGSAELGADQRKYVAEVGRMLRERAKLTLEICGLATAPDWPALEDQRLLREREQAESGLAGRFRALARIAREKLTAQPEEEAPLPPPDEERLNQLASERADAVRRMLALDEKIDAGRLFECRPKALLKSQDQARVELRF